MDNNEHGKHKQIEAIDANNILANSNELIENKPLSNERSPILATK